jgi:hypothetical protein
MAFVPVSRTRSLTRAVIYAFPALVLAATAQLVYSGVNLRVSALSTQFVQYSLLLCALVLAIISLTVGLLALRRALLAGWPGALGFYAYESELLVRLGPFGSKRYAVERLDIRYPYECTDDDATFEAMLPEEKQHQTLLPDMQHPEESTPLNVMVTQFAVGSEKEIVVQLRPAIERWRRIIASRDKQTPVLNP